MTATAVAPQTTAPDITLEVHVCNQRRSYRVTFTGPTAEDQAIAFLEARSAGGTFYPADGRYGNHAWFEIEELPVDERYTRLIDFLYPLCEHQMSLDNCYGPMHFMDAAQERALWG